MSSWLLPPSGLGLFLKGPGTARGAYYYLDRCNTDAYDAQGEGTERDLLKKGEKGGMPPL
ncbi:MAG: hypothetical protein KDD34_05080 [Bdellovibrionales bacterium]|nr:hypothetical protein [Bdellovibrionales bacterium]